MLEKVTRMALLYDFYGALLTDKQQEVFHLYYEDNLSLGEISEGLGISRQAVYDLLKRGEKTLETYEDKLGLVAKFQNQREMLQEAAGILQAISPGNEGVPSQDLMRLKELVNRILEIQDLLV